MLRHSICLKSTSRSFNAQSNNKKVGLCCVSMRRWCGASATTTPVVIQTSGALVPSSSSSTVCCAMRHNSTPSSSSTTMKDFGFEHSTPNFNLDMGNMPTDADLGDVVTSPARNVTLAQLNGPWLVMAEGLNGELFVEKDGYVLFRPAVGLGYGVGRVSVTDSTIGLTTFQLQLEAYLYENISANPPLLPKRFDLVGMISSAKASKSAYETLTLHGRDFSSLQQQQGSSSSSQQQPPPQSTFNAAKLTPWSAETAAPPAWKGPSEEVREGFSQLFPSPLKLSSHLLRREESKKRPPPPARSNSPLATTAGYWTEPAVHMDLSQYKVGTIDNVYYIPNYISPDEQQQMLAQLHDTPEAFKSKLTKRTVQEWGCTMCPTCQQSFVSEANLPPWTEAVSDMLLYDGIYSPTLFPNNVRIHEYEVGEGIAPHCDGPIYVPKVSILSLASTSVMNFYSRRDPYDQPMEHYNDTFKFDGVIAKEVPLMSVVMEPGSLLIFDQDAYTHHPHGISDKAVDSLDPSVSGPVVNRHWLTDPNVTEVVRKYRVGVTIRNLLPRCQHDPERAEYNLKRAWQLYHQTAEVGYYLPPVVGPSTSAPTTKPSTKTFAAPQQQKQQPPPQQTSSSSQHQTASIESVRSLEAKLDRILANQSELLRTVGDLQQIVSASVTSQHTFQQETSTVLNHLSSTVLQIESQVEELTERGGNLP
ncbi:2OG-Fe(II) oxygenase, putative [Bodo saltans]|uniref:2OG-Fe(II) oxygenase, putative n=1 Tax=Bodo saltans TaxID=75058 RepID=A0A0S4JGT6_BODSA|nr:2OG-Fe(II) oxygenase, putative [Bodo saltans]|eukprot:CUG89394.1 2OG-Fe(II) oxygenase, putative [Bodo saltans]